MGFLSLIPADQVTATYFVQKRQLVLQASGTVPWVTTGIKFEPVPFFVGGLKYTLEGWTGPLTEETEQYTIESSFTIQLPNRATPSGSLIVETANHPDGLVVPIVFDGIIIVKQTQGTVPPVVAQEPTTPAPPTFLVLPDEQVNALWKESFTIKQSAQVAETGYVNVKFDDKFLVLLSAGIKGSDIVWTFNSLQMGFTQVIVEFNESASTFHQSKTYNVHIFLPGGPSAPPGPTLLQAHGGAQVSTSEGKGDSKQVSESEASAADKPTNDAKIPLV
jgi:hypothetical protein